MVGAQLGFFSCLKIKGEDQVFVFLRAGIEWLMSCIYIDVLYLPTSL